MSSNSSTSTEGLPTGFVLTGGIPLKNQDFAASILFIVAYALSVPLLVWRISRKSSRTLVLIRPAIFVGIRIATYVVRAIQADGNESEALFVTEQIFLLCGFLLLLEPFSTLVKFNLYRHWVPKGKRHSFSRLLLLIRLAVFTAIGLGIYIGSNTQNARNDPGLESTISRCRWVGGGLALAVVVLSLCLAVYAQIRGFSDLRRTAYLATLGTCLLIPSVYKLVLYADPSHPFSSSGKAVFYILFSLPELLAIILYLSVNLETTFEIKEGSAKEKWNKKARKGKLNGAYLSPYREDSLRGSHEMLGKDQV
ncbi:hypothetical protein JCM5350_006053 [Sporobolomyces pararoseus]